MRERVWCVNIDSTEQITWLHLGQAIFGTKATLNVRSCCYLFMYVKGETYAHTYTPIYIHSYVHSRVTQTQK